MEAGRTTQTLSSGTPVTVIRPASGSKRQVVILPDVAGLGPVFDRVAEEVARNCDATVGVIELFPGREHLTFEERLDVGLTELSEDRVLADAVEAADSLGGAPTAILGVCIGGALAMRAAPTGRFARIASLYGMVHLPPKWRNGKGDPLEAVASSDIPVHAIAGTADQFITLADLDELEAAGAHVSRVPEAKHGFAHNPGLPSHDADAARAAWGEIYGFLTRSD